jgi:hypothetical protein
LNGGQFYATGRWFEIMSEVLNSEALMQAKYIFGQIQDGRMAVTLKTFY